MNPLLISPLLDIGKAIIAKVWPDPVQQAEAQLKLAQLQQNGELAELNAQVQLMLAQTNINAIEAAQPSNFRGGWRPFIGWVCGVGLAYQFVVRPVTNGLLIAYGHTPVMPALETDTLMALVTGMLGFGGMRTAERLKGKA